jgi:hypothetical protein
MSATARRGYSPAGNDILPLRPVAELQKLIGCIPSQLAGLAARGGAVA